MKLAQLFSVFPQLKWGDAAQNEVVELTQDSRRVKPGVVFVAVNGTSSDGHKFIPEVVEKGALALVVESEVAIPKSYKGAIVKVANSREALDRLAARFYGEPAQNLFCVAVTGTNGKTSTTYMVEAILNKAGFKCGVLGTIDHHFLDHVWESQLTTPDPLTMQRRLKEFLALGAGAAAFEVSSHALSQHRADSLDLDVGIFTNFTRDHLDYHKTMEEYFSAKERLFTDVLARTRKNATAILNFDDPQVQKTQVSERVSTWWFGQGECDFKFRILKQDLNGTLFHLTTPRGNAEIHLGCPGLHNVYNAVGAIAACCAKGVALETAATAMHEFHGAPGRLERVENSKGLNIFVDYAHTDDALISVLRGINELRGGGNAKIITVFGCGGDRDKGKRPLMLKAALKGSDKVIITSDNPRTENPQDIINDIVQGSSDEDTRRISIEPDRKRAIALALQSAREGDVILIAGKGHENYQIVGTEKLPFSDVQTAKELLKG
jgi:UDP-N-acetylmuramoyl-L-alanyl-D-glutamate--2,6-diaminopimelate ligase